jgi:hypothetical protein
VLSNSEKLPQRQRRITDWFIVASVNLIIPVVILWKLHEGDIESTVATISCWISLALLSAVLTIGFSRRNRIDGGVVSRRLLFGIFIVAILTGLITTFAIGEVGKGNSYMKLAASSKPLSEIYPEKKRLVVEAIRRTEANSKENSATAATFKPISPPLYSVDSFSSIAIMKATSQQLDEAFELDKSYAEKQRAVMSDFRRKMANVDPDFLKSWNLARADQESSEAATEAIEQRWVLNTIALYDYAVQHRDEFSLARGALEFSSPILQKEFQSREDRCKELQHEMQAHREELIAYQMKAQANLGLH